MDDLDDELFQFAAGGAKSADKKRSRRAASDDSEDDGGAAGSSGEEDSDEEARRPARKQRVGGGGKIGALRRSAKLDDGEVPEDFDEEDLYEDEDDRKRLMAMTELEREMILAQRGEKLKQDLQRRQLLQQTRTATEKVDARASRSRAGARTGKESQREALRSLEAARERQGAKRADKAAAAAAAGGPGRPRRAPTAAARSAAAWSDDSEGEEGAAGDSDDEGRRGDRGRGGRKKRDSSDDEDEFQPSDADESPELSEASGGSSLSDADRRRAGAGSDDEGEVVRDKGPAAARRREDVTDAGGAGERDRAYERGVMRDGRPERAGGPEADLGGRLGGAYDDDMRRGPALGHVDDEEAPEEASIEELRSIQVTRTQLEEWHTKPFFEGEKLSGAVVRMAYGDGGYDAAGNKLTGYMIMEIMDIREGNRQYKFAGTMTNKMLYLQDGLGVRRTMAMANVSSKEIQQAEYERYLRHCSRAQHTPLSKSQVAEALERINAAANYRWAAEDLRAVLARKRETGQAPVNLAAEKAEIKRKLQAAIDAGRHEEVAQLEAQLADIDAAVLARVDPAAYKLGDKNRANRFHTLQVAFKSTAKQEEANAAANDVFSRRATRPNIYWNTKGKGGSAAAKANAEAAMPQKLTTAQQRMDPLELIRELNMDIDMGLLQGVSVVPSLERRVLGPKWTHTLNRHRDIVTDLSKRSVLTVADWKRRAGEF